MNKKSRFLSAALALVLLTGCQSAAPSQSSDAPQNANTSQTTDPSQIADAPQIPGPPAETGDDSVQFTVGTYLCGDTYFSFYLDGVSGSTTQKGNGQGLGFTYEVEGEQVIFHMGSMEDSTVATVTAVDEETFDVKWADGRQETMSFVSYLGPEAIPQFDTDVFYQNARDWFTGQISEYELLDGLVCGDAAIFLTGIRNPSEETYQFLQVFVVEAAGGSYEVAAWRDGQYGVPAGFTAYVLATDELTVIFGDTDTRNFSQAKVEMSDGLFELRPLTGYQPYLIALDYRQEISDVAFTDEMGFEVRYSEYFSNDLMADSASADIIPLS